MTKKFNFFVLLFVLSVNCSDHQNEPEQNFRHIKPTASAETQKAAVEALISRAIGKDSSRFEVEIKSDFPQNTFEIIKQDNNTIVIIRGSDGVSACKGFYHYLKYYLNSQISWSDKEINIPNQLVAVNLRMSSASRFIYYQNVCTWSYSFAWWTWNDWRQHIDWMAMEGISLTIAPIQETIWTRVYRKFWLSEEEIDNHFAGPAFQAWQRMGNIRGWGGYLTEDYKNQQQDLQKKIIDAQRELGMTVAIPAFAGHIPVGFKRLFPNATLTKTSNWNRFPPNYCCPLFIEPTDPLFHTIGEMFLKEIINVYGTDHIYFSDPFNEIIPSNMQSAYIQNTSASIYNTMKSVDNQAVWLLQGWMFLNPIWSNNLIKSFLTAVPIGKILILDLMSEQFPLYEKTQSFYGQPFIWCMLHNFGGTHGMHGSVKNVNENITAARNMVNSSIVGVGITPEGINQNYVMYELALERGWSNNEFNLSDWFDKYSISRYGKLDIKALEAWRLLKNSVYSYYGIIKLHGKYSIARRPSIKLLPWTWYDSNQIKLAWENLLNADESIHSNKFYQHDLVDVTRQFLQNSFDQIYVNTISAYNSQNEIVLQRLQAIAVELFTDLDKLLKSDSNFLLGKWLEAAKNFSADQWEREKLELNARNQITLWGPDGQIVDYATKQWSGVVEDYFLPRWELFFREILDCVSSKRKFSENKFKSAVYENIEVPFNKDKKIYPIYPEGHSIEISWAIYRKWVNLTNSAIFTEKVPIKLDGKTALQPSNPIPSVVLG